MEASLKFRELFNCAAGPTELDSVEGVDNLARLDAFTAAYPENESLVLCICASCFPRVLQHLKSAAVVPVSDWVLIRTVHQ